jgi:hypothetical protein
MNARATLLNGRTVKANGGAMVIISETQYNFEVVLDI